jgi:hypothetical protein
MAHLSYDADLRAQASGGRTTARTVRSVLLTTCFLVCGSAALAQSREYQRGYDEGFQAGRSSVAPAPGFRQGGRGIGMRIRILDARYGDGRRHCDARRSVQQIVDQRGEGVFQVSNALCGQWSPNAISTLEVTYQCGRNNPVHTSAEEGQNMRIRCH